MGPERGDQLVVAGMNPNSLTSANSTFARVHRGTTFIVFIDGLIVMYLFWIISSIVSESASNITLVVLGITNLLIQNHHGQ